jgi:ribonucleotide monophosphatase NagD (HAD superfamily)
MVGDTIDSDIKGALNAHLVPILYSPTAQESQLLLLEQNTPVIRYMAEPLDTLGIANDVTAWLSLSD